MSGEMAGAADIVTGAAVARAVEPDAGEGKAAEADGNCLNCGAALIGKHCHVCGQKAQVHRTLRAFGHDILHSVLHFDGKIWRTLPMLFWNPGVLTRRYVHGERAKFVSPLALFLFTVFLTFAMFNWLMPDDGSGNPAVTVKAAQATYQAERKEILDDIAKLESDRQKAISSSTPGYGWMDGEIARKRQSLKKLEEASGNKARTAEVGAPALEAERRQLEGEMKRLEAEISAARKAGRPTTALEEQMEGNRIGIQLLNGAATAFGNGKDGADSSRFTDLEFPGAAALNKAVAQARENPQLLLYKMQSNAYKYSWALIPISLPFVWLLFFWRRRFKMFDHAVFVTYSLTFMMLLGVISALLISSPQTEVLGGFVLVIVPPIHMYRHIHHAYETSRFGALWRTFMLSFFAMAALALFATLIIALGIS